jgi:hypothetical protein
LFGFCETVMARMHLRRREMKAGSVHRFEKFLPAGMNLTSGNGDGP